MAEISSFIVQNGPLVSYDLLPGQDGKGHASAKSLPQAGFDYPADKGDTLVGGVLGGGAPPNTMLQNVGTNRIRYVMMARDPDCGSPTYRTWVSYGLPDTTGALYTGTRCGVSPLVDFQVLSVSYVYG